MPPDQSASHTYMLNYDPSTITGALVWGVLAGILTTVLLLLLSQLFQKVVLPWYQSVVYKGIDLRGKWVAQKIFDEGVTYYYSMLLKQNAHSLTGSMTIIKMNSQAGPPGGQEDYVQGFEVTGVTWEGFVTLNMTSDDRRSLSFATSLLQVRNRGHNLAGHMAYRSSIVDQVDSEDITWTRS